MLTYFRTPAMSEVRTGSKLEEIRAVASAVVGLETEICFYVDVREPLTVDEERILNWLLAETFEPEKFGSQSFFVGDADVIEVGPRLGLVTPWSTSARTIFQACNLPKVNRVEAARRYHLVIGPGASLEESQLAGIRQLLHDRMTEQVYPAPLSSFDSGVIAETPKTIPLIEEGKAALQKFAAKFGLSLTPGMMDYIYDYFVHDLKRDPVDVELFMFGQVNSEHCRHHIFNGRWQINGKIMPRTLFEMVKDTAAVNPGNLFVAFTDNAAVLSPVGMKVLQPASPGLVSNFTVLTVGRSFVLKVETHNHPTTVSPYAGAATGVAVRRDIFGTGRGGVSIGHLAGYYVGHLFIPGYSLPWEKEPVGYSSRFASPLRILIEASNGASDNANCFGNPVVVGTTRSFEQIVGGVHYGYRKTAMVAGSFGYIEEYHVAKGRPVEGMLIVQTGGPAFPIGVGGGSGSSKDAGGQELTLDFNSVQRDDAFTERGNLNVIRACSELGDENPIVTLTDLGAGGDCVALPELVFPAGAQIELRQIPCGDKTMTVLVNFCNEAQERMAYLIWSSHLSLFAGICERHRCPVAAIGDVARDGRLVLYDSEVKSDAPAEQSTPINVDMPWLLADLPQRQIVCQTIPRRLEKSKIPPARVADHLNLVFRLLDVGSKEFLTHKADRTVGNRTVRQQEVGPLQLPIADCAVMSDSPFGITGNVIAIGEQPIKGLVDNEAGIRMSVGEALTNAVWAPVRSLSDLSFSATWQWPGGQPGEDARLYQAVQAAKEGIIKLLTRIGVGKDSLSMTLKEKDGEGNDHLILAPGTVQMTAFGPCCDINQVVTPDIKRRGESKLMFIDLAKGKQRLGGSALLRVYGQIGNDSPDLDDADFFLRAWAAVQRLMARGLILAGHDRSDGGLISCVLEMAFAGNCGVKLNLRGSRLGGNDRDRLLFNEELGLVIEFLPKHYEAIRGILRRAGVAKHCHIIGETKFERVNSVLYDGEFVMIADSDEQRSSWRETSFRLDGLQASPVTVAEERQSTHWRYDPQWSLSFVPKSTPRSIMTRSKKPRAAVLSEAGTNGDRDAAETLYLSGFEPADVQKIDLISGKASLQDYQFLFLPGGFSFRDTLDAGKGGAGVFKFNQRAADELAAFTERNDTLMFGACNGCQEMALLGILPWAGIPTEKLPRFILNKSERFEHRLVSVRVFTGGGSVFLKDIAGSVLGIIVSHGQGRFHCPDEDVYDSIIAEGLAPIRYVNDEGEITDQYPFNPNGSPQGIAGLSSRNGRFLAMMPHSERLPLNNLWPWQPREWKKLKASPWLKIFQNAREWCEQA